MQAIENEPMGAMKVILICGPWGSGTSVLAGLLANLGAFGLPPYLKTKDPRTRNSYESVAFREIILRYASQPALSLIPCPPGAVQSDLRSLQKRVEQQEFGFYDTRFPKPVFLKHPLSALLIPEICEVFDASLICVMRPLEDIERTRFRRSWPSYFGAQGAVVIYSHISAALRQHPYPSMSIEYRRLLASPLACADDIARFTDLEPSPAELQRAVDTVRQGAALPSSGFATPAPSRDGGQPAARSPSPQRAPSENAIGLTGAAITQAEAMELAVKAYRAGRLSEAEGLCQAILATRPDLCDALRALAVIQARLGRRTEALASYERVLALRPDDAEALNNCGNLLRSLGRGNEALASYERALRVRPDYAEALNNRGGVLGELQRFEEALASCEQALALRPDDAAALSNRGHVLVRLRRFEEALASYEAAIALKPDHVDVLCNRGHVLVQLQRFEEALASYEAVIARKPDHADTFYNRGHVLGQLQRFEHALASYEKAIALKPDHADAFCDRGHVLARLRRFEEALASYDKAIALQPDNWDAFHGRGVTLGQLQRFDAAPPSCESVPGVGCSKDTAAIMAELNPEKGLKHTSDRVPVARPDAIDLIGPWFDHPRAEPAAKTLIICAAPRTGSRELGRLLMAAGIGVAHEYFNPNYARVAAPRWGLASDVLIPEHIEQYIAELRRRRSGGGVFATNLQFDQFRDHLCNKHGKALFQDAVVVHLFRADVVRQFVSLHKAQETGRYDFSDRTPRPRQRLADLLGKQGLIRGATGLVTQDAGFRRLFLLAGIHPIFVESEEFFRNPQAVVERISQTLGVAVDQDRLGQAIAVSKPYEYGQEDQQDREQMLLSIMQDSAFAAW